MSSGSPHDVTKTHALPHRPAGCLRRRAKPRDHRAPLHGGDRRTAEL